MKKTLLLLSILLGLAYGASAQCTADTSNFVTGQYLYPSQLTCIQQTTSYSQTQTLRVPDSLPYTLSVLGQSYTVTGYIDSIQIDTITGEPSGITTASNPALGVWLYPNQYSCSLFSGTTSAPVADYPLTISGRACGHFTIPVVGGTFDTCISYTFTNSYPDTLTVCYPAGVANVSGNLNLNVYPNPNQGNFTVTISSASEINGTMSVVDELGRTINTQSIDVTGTKQIPLEMSNLSPGAYLLEINSANGRSVKQFIVK